MDGHFVPNIVMGAPILQCVSKAVPKIFMDCHMMVSEPLKVRKELCTDVLVDQRHCSGWRRFVHIPH